MLENLCEPGEMIDFVPKTFQGFANIFIFKENLLKTLEPEVTKYLMGKKT